MFCQLTKDRPYRVKSVTTTMKPVRTIIWNNFMTRVMKTDTTEMKPVSVFLQGIGSLELLILYSGFCMLLRKFLFT